MTEMNFSYLIDGALHAALGLVVFATALWALERSLGFNVRKQVVDEKNVAAAILAGLIALGTAVIVAASVH
jgi:putative membrane protein